MRPAQVIALFAGLSAALSWEGAFEDAAAKAVQGIENVERLFRRQDEGGDAATSETTATPTRQTGSATRAGSATGSRGTITGSARASGDAEESGAATSEFSIDPREAPGGVSMQTPGPFDGPQFYKVGDWVTFAWNYTSVVSTPKAVNVLATCSQINAEWTIAANMTYESNQTVFWDTNQYAGKQTPQLVVATYTLIIENAEEAIATANPTAGQLGSWKQQTFGMYNPQDYVPFSEFTCPMCNSASSERQALGFMLSMFSITILSFTYLATGRFGIF